MLDNTRFSTPVGPLVLSRSVALDYRNAEQKISIGPHCWTNPNAELCVPQTIDAGAEGRAQINLNRFDLAMLKPFMPETTQASGVFSGKADVAWDTTKEGLPQGSVTLSGRNVKVTQEVNDAPLPVAFDTLNVNADLHNNRAELGWLIRLTNNGQFDGQVQITDPQGTAQSRRQRQYPQLQPGDGEPDIRPRGEKREGCSAPTCVWRGTRKARSCSARCGSTAWTSTVTLCRLICSPAS